MPSVNASTFNTGVKLPPPPVETDVSCPPAPVKPMFPLTGARAESPPPEGESSPLEGEEEAYCDLQDILRVYGLPGTQRRGWGAREESGGGEGAPSRVEDSRLCVVVLAPRPADGIALALEGGDQCPGDMLLVLSRSWLSTQQTSPPSPDTSLPPQSNGYADHPPVNQASSPAPVASRTNSLYAHRAVTCEQGGRTFLDVLDPPRRVTYFINQSEASPPGGCHGDGDSLDELEAGLDCPVSSLGHASFLQTDRLRTRLLMAVAGLLVPPTLAFAHSGGSEGQEGGRVRVVGVQGAGGEERVMREIEKFLGCEDLRNHSTVVVKAIRKQDGRPSTTTFQPHDDVVGIQRAALRILGEMGGQDGTGGVLIEGFVETMQPRVKGSRKGSGGPPKWGVNGRSFVCRVAAAVCRGGDGTPCLSSVVCGVGSRRAPPHGDDVIPQSLETTLAAYGVTDDVTVAEVKAALKSASELFLRSLCQGSGVKGGDGVRADGPDLVGVHFILTDQGEGRVIPVALGALGPARMARECAVYEAMHASERGGAMRLLLEGGVARAQRFGMQDKVVLVVGAGYFSKMYIWPTAREFGIKVILIDENPTHAARPLVDTFLHYNLSDHTQDPQHARAILALLALHGLAPHGVVTFWEDCGPLAALLSAALGLGGAGVCGALTAKNKSATQRAFQPAMINRAATATRLGEVAEALTNGVVERDDDVMKSQSVVTNGFVTPPTNDVTIPQATNGLSTPNNSPWDDVEDVMGISNGQPIKALARLEQILQLQKKIETGSNTSPLTHPPSRFGTPGFAYSSKFFHIGCDAELEAAIPHMDFPAVIKLEHGAGAVGVALVGGAEECWAVWGAVQRDLAGESSRPGVGLSYGNSMLLMDYLGGTEHDVDIILYKGGLVGAFVSDNGPTRLPRFTETAGAMPSCLPADKRHQLVAAAHRCCAQIGLETGVFNVEMKMCPTGPRLIEINARMAGFYLRDWIKVLYDVDLLHCAFMLACGLRPTLPHPASLPHLCSAPRPPAQLIGVMAVASVHRGPLSDPATLALLADLEAQGEVRVTRMEGALAPPSSDAYEEPYLNIGVLDPDLERAKARLVGVCERLGIDSERYPVREFLADFVRVS